MRLLLPPRLLRPLLTLPLPRVMPLPAPPPTRALPLPTLLPALPMPLPTLRALPLTRPLLRPRKPLLRRSKRLL